MASMRRSSLPPMPRSPTPNPVFLAFSNFIVNYHGLLIKGTPVGHQDHRYNPFRAKKHGRRNRAIKSQYQKKQPSHYGFNRGLDGAPQT